MPVSLSVCIATAESPERVAAVLAPLRDIQLDEIEIVLALDDRADAALDERYGASVDRILRFPFRDPPARTQPWLAAQCNGRWILRLDADEVPSTRLAAEVRNVIEADEVTHAWIPRRWLWPDGASTLAAWPWQPDYQLRLMRNDPATVRLPGEMHCFAQASGAHRFLRAPIYHADLVLNDRASRQEKVRRYAGVRRGLRIAGDELNAAYYLPERRPTAPVAAVPEVDAGAVAALFDPPPCGTGTSDVEAADAERVEAFWLARPFREGDYTARLTLRETDHVVYSGETRTFDVEVTNTSSRAWPWGMDGPPEIRLAHRWHRPGRSPIEGLRTPLPHTVHPQASALVPVQLGSPPESGLWELEIDIVHEHVRWFGVGVRIPVTCVG